MNQIEQLKNQVKQLKEMELKTPEQLVDEWIDYIKGDMSDPLTTGFKSVDELLRNRLRGKVMAKIGYGGTKKSLAALQGAIRNHTTQRRGIYSTMEMSSSNLLERIIDMSMHLEDKPYSSVSREYERAVYNGMAERVAELLKSSLGSIFGDRLQITQKSRMRAEDYHNVITKYNEHHEAPLDYLIVDGLSMMGGAGTETEMYTTNSGELKDLAKEHNIFIDLICHCSKTSGGIAGKKHTRDNSRFIRGSEKILDNVDCYMMFSLVQDEQHLDEYQKDFGYMRFFDKRGTGQTISKIYKFHDHNLNMEETELDPNSFEYDNKKGGLL